jgi:hypothetical protein
VVRIIFGRKGDEVTCLGENCHNSPLTGVVVCSHLTDYSGNCLFSKDFGSDKVLFLRILHMKHCMYIEVMPDMCSDSGCGNVNSHLWFVFCWLHNPYWCCYRCMETELPFYQAHLNRFHLKAETESSLRDFASLNINRTVVNIQNCDNYINRHKHTERSTYTDCYRKWFPCRVEYQRRHKDRRCSRHAVNHFMPALKVCNTTNVPYMRYCSECGTSSTQIIFMIFLEFVRFEVFTAVTMNNGVFWDVTPCGSCKNRHFGGT